MFLERLHQYRLRHFQPIIQTRQIFAAVQSLGRYSAQGSVKVVDTFDQVKGEAGDGEIAGGLYIALCAFLKIAEVCY